MPIRSRQSALLGIAGSLTAALAPAVHAQMHHVDAPERVTRAIGVYEWTGDLAKPSAARFVPVSLFIDGHFEDAGLYLARPVPFALQPGDVYALERAGEPQGLLDLDSARRIVTNKAVADDNSEGAWYAFGRFTPETAPRAPVALHSSGHLPTLHASAGPSTPTGAKVPAPEDTDDNRPHMTRRDSSTQTGSTSTSGSQPNSSSPTSSGSPSPTGSGTGSSTPTPSTTTPPSTSKPDDSDDTDRPTLRRRDPSQDAARRREYGTKGNQSGVTAAGPALGEDPDRPHLGRGAAHDESIAELSGLPADMHQAVAVSDASHRDNHAFTREWDSPAERADTLAAMAALAKPRLAAYLAANNLVPSSAPLTSAAAGQASAPVPAAAPATSSEAGAPPHLQRGVPSQYQHSGTATASSQPAPAQPAPAASTSTHAASGTAKSTAAHRATHATAKTAAPKAAPLAMGQETLSGFTLSYGGLPTFVFTAAASAAPAKEPTATAAGTNPTAYITLIAQRLPSGQLQVALTAVTDSGHLDRSPRLRLIDAVDPDDSHRASLLFELRGTGSRQFALYRLTTAQAEQTFTTASIE